LRMAPNLPNLTLHSHLSW